ncbi:MAG: hypothetical protein R3C49_13140 [Planctomycetaceae bacterium]
MVRVSDAERSYEGKVVALTTEMCSLMDRQGQLHHLNVRSLRNLEKTAAHYEPYSSGSFRHELLQEFRDGYEVSGTTRYVVCAPAGRASAYAQLFESIYRDVEQFYRVRGFRVRAPEVPLVAVVFRDRQEFARYCAADNVPPSPTLMGYYSLLTNRVAMFDDGGW